MKSWFPFTDYDFYAYLTAGLTVLFAVDYAFNNGAIMLRESWPVVQIIFVLAIAYILGQILAGAASILLEHWLARRVLHPPVALITGIAKLRLRERLISKWVVGRYYEPFPLAVRQDILNRVATSLGCQPNEIDDPEQIFQVAFPTVRALSDVAA